jgi:hypothetical protein
VALTEADMLGLLRGPTTDRALGTILITIAGSPQPSAVIRYYIVSYPRNGRHSFKVSSEQGTLGADALAIDAHSIQMVPHANFPPLNQINGYLLDNTGPDLMVTGMLNGCSFIMKADAQRTSVRCAHLQPIPGAGGGELLNTQCINTAAFAGDAGPVVVFGRNNYPVTTGGRSCTVLGVRRRGVWSIYAQQFDAFFNIVSATQIL